ncbi:hypothetical protein SteCoe_7986 [Stentor coeruleus]|uniref:Uncharacterized protein n=1 Tax=Stentor coeruleus TaxID=5963 RepID=A0A1R2CLB7_9CILI|nr:hypothetical protein SteCoe_7986 [Stentor coeruleus]
MKDSERLEEGSEKSRPFNVDKAFGVRDALLVKCRDTIESLNNELDEERRSRKILELKVKELENGLGILEHKLRQQNTEIEELKVEIELRDTSIEQYENEIKKLQSLKPLHEAQGHMQSTMKSLEHSLSTLQEENLKLKQQLEAEKARSKEMKAETLENRSRRSIENERLDLEKIEQELEELYDKKHKCMIKDFEKKQEVIKEELTSALDEVDSERQRYQEMYKASNDENTQLRQEIKYLQNMLQRKQSQLEKHSQQSLDQLQSILEKKNNEETEAYKLLINTLEKEKADAEAEKIALEHEVSRLKDHVEDTHIYLRSSEEVRSECIIMRKKVLELEKSLQAEINEKQYLSQSLEDMKKIIQGSDNDTYQESRKIELVKLKYQTLLQAELQKRLRDKQSFKQHLIQDKEAFLTKLRAKDEKIASLESEKQELLATIDYIEERRNEVIDRDSRIVNEETARVLFI